MKFKREILIVLVVLYFVRISSLALCMSLDGNAFSDTLKTSAKVDSVVNGKVTILMQLW